MRKPLFLITLFFSICIATTAAQAFEQFSSSPGTRAMGMAGAFTAQADDSSAIWYNPAGLIQPNVANFDITAEYGSLPSSDAAGNISSDDTNLKFISVGGKLGNLGAGISYFVPYRLSFPLPSIGEVDVDYDQVSIAFAISLLNQNLQIGASGDMLAARPDCGNENCEVFAGVGYTLGALYKIIDTEFIDIKGGALYRGKVTLDANDDTTLPGTAELEVFKNIPARPEQLALGLNAQIALPHMLQINLNTNYEKTYWAKAKNEMSVITSSDYSKVSFGGEITKSIFDSALVSLRAGWSKATPDDSSFEEITSLSYGVGASAKGLSIDFAIENRELETAGDFQFWSVSLSYQI